MAMLAHGWQEEDVAAWELPAPEDAPYIRASASDLLACGNSMVVYYVVECALLPECMQVAMVCVVLVVRLVQSCVRVSSSYALTMLDVFQLV